jgi:hypothetical protein
MNIVKTIEQYDNKNIYFCDPIKNNVLQDGNFIRILYFTENVSLNGIYLLIPLKNVSVERYYNKVKYLFDLDENREIIEKIKGIEETILSKIASYSQFINNKSPQFNIYDNFIHQNIKMHMNNNTFMDSSASSSLTPPSSPKSNTHFHLHNSVILKISGVWSTEQQYGLTYKHFQPASIHHF